jgi:hypothetical protein
VSNRGAERLGGLRVIRLLDIELGERPPLSAWATGPLGGDVIWVWIDAPTPRVALVEVRRFDRPVSRRNLAIKDLDGDVAARLVALVASEMVRAQARASLTPTAPKPAPGPRSPGAAEADSLAAIVLTAATRALWLPASSAPLLGGSELGLAHRLGATSQQIYLAWLGAPASDPAARLIEVGTALDVQLSLGSPDWRLHLGGRVGAAQLWLPAAADVDGLGADWGWTARAAAGAAGSSSASPLGRSCTRSRPRARRGRRGPSAASPSMPAWAWPPISGSTSALGPSCQQA